MKNKDTEKNMKKMLEGSEDCFILATKNGTAFVGRGDELLTLATLLLRDLRQVEGCPEQAIDDVYRLSKMSKAELAKDILEKLKERLEKGE